MSTLTNDCDDYVMFSKAVNGDHYAFDRLVAKYKPRLHAAAYRVTQNHDQASDAVTDALLRLYRTGDTFRYESKLSTWLHRVVVNCARDIARRTRARPMRSLEYLLEVHGEQDLHAIEPIEPEDDHEEIMHLAQQKIIEELTHLPEPERDLLLAVHLYHTPYEHLALDLHIPVGTVKSRIFRARRMLKDRLPTMDELEMEHEEAPFAELVA